MAKTKMLRSQNILFDPKQQNLPFTIGLIKPNTCLKIENVQKIINQIQSNGFVIKNLIQRELFKEEAINLYYKHQKKPFFEQIVSYLLSGQCCVFLLTHESENPLQKWKKMIGPADPQEAKKKFPNSLRAIYGSNLTKNQFYGSDDFNEANKQRQIFQFKIPQKPPAFIETPYKLNLNTLKKFLHPPNLEHSSINERMDIFAIYGPIVNWHSIQRCFCKNCVKVVRTKIQQIKKSKPQSKSKPLKLLKQQDISSISDELCTNCRDHCEKYVHLQGGRQGQHLLTDAEINQLAYQINKKQLTELLAIQKGSAAKTMIQTIDIKQPKEVSYNMNFVEMLIQDLQTDYYDRYDFTEMQNLILEDRRIRMVYWISKLTQKPVERFPPVTSLDNTLTKDQLENPKSPFFTLTRTKPLPLLIQLQDIRHTPLQHSSSIVDKKKLQDQQQNLAIEKKIHRNLTKVSTIGEKHQGSKMAVTLLREYNQGRHGSWNNYSGLKGNSIKEFPGGRNIQKSLKE